MREGTRFRRWTADTKIAFLMALRMSGSAKDAAAAIGRPPHSAYEHRRKDPDFAARWQATLAEFEAERVAAEWRIADDRGVMPNRVRYDGFTPLRQRAFLRALSETGHVRQACEKVRISNAAAYRMRQRFPSFADAWDRALAQSPATLEQAAFERAVEGVEEPIFHAGLQVGTRRRYSDMLMRHLLVMRERRDAAAMAAAAKLIPARTADDALASLLAKLDAMERKARAEAGTTPDGRSEPPAD